jgi:PPOX class probable F420-dependent enzyme
MTEVVPDEYRDLIGKKVVAILATIMHDGGPQATPVWFEVSDGYFVVNSAKGRQKDINMRKRPKVSLSIQDPDNPYRYLEVRGQVVEITEEGADAHIDKLTKNYLGMEKYPYGQEGEVRVIYRIKPDRIIPYG